MRSKADRRGIGDYWLSKDPKSPNWCRTWFDAASRQTRRATLGTSDPDAALEALAEWFVLHRRLERESSKAVPLAIILDRYLAEHAAGSRSEVQARISVRYWKEAYGDALVSELSVIEQEKFIRDLRKRELSDAYIGRILTIGKAALNRAKRRQELADVPHILTVTGGRERSRVLTIEESRALWRAVDSEHVGMYLRLAFNTAARPDAILGLDLSQFDLERRLVNLNPEGRRQTKKFRPVIPVTNDLFQTVSGLTGGPLVRWNGKRVQSIKTGFRALRRRAGLDPDVIPYTIRHTIATELRGAGVAPWEVAGWLGHKITELRTTERYAKFAPSYLSAAREAIDAYMQKVLA